MPMNIRWARSAGLRMSAGFSMFLPSESGIHATFNKNLSELNGRRIMWGIDESDLLVFRYEADGERGWLVNRNQVLASPIRKLGIPPATRIHFTFDPEQAIFIESRRERVGPRGGTSGTIGATRQIAELQP